MFTRCALLALAMGLSGCDKGGTPTEAVHSATPPVAEPSASAAAIAAPPATAPTPSGSASAGAADTKQAVTTPVGRASGPVVALIEPGAEPRRVLRYAFKKGQKDRVKLVSSTGLALSVGGKAMPTPPMPDVEMLGSVRVQSVKPDATARRDLVIEHLQILPAPGSPAMPAELTRSLAAVAGMTGSDRVQPNGLVTTVELDTSRIDDPQLQQLLASLQGSLGQMSAPFPDEEVGIGARWKVSTKVTQQGMPFEQLAVYRLEKLDGDRGEAHIDIEQHAPKGHVALPGIPAGVDTTLLGMKSSGTGKVEFDLAHSVQRGKLEVTTVVDVRISAAGETNDTHMEMKLATRFEPAKAGSRQK